MFYSQLILAKKGPLGTIWIAAHLERKLRKNQVTETNISVSVDSILFPEAPIALRLSGHLLLGVVRIYSRKVNYLFHDCSEALTKIKQAFHSGAVDLPPEASIAPFHAITLPENFDLDEFEPLGERESMIIASGAVDQHVTTRELITLQDTAEENIYFGSQFGLDDRLPQAELPRMGLDFEEEREKEAQERVRSPRLTLEEEVAPSVEGYRIDFDRLDEMEAMDVEQLPPMTPALPTMVEVDVEMEERPEQMPEELEQLAPIVEEPEQLLPVEEEPEQLVPVEEEPVAEGTREELVEVPDELVPALEAAAELVPVPTSPAPLELEMEDVPEVETLRSAVEAPAEQAPDLFAFGRETARPSEDLPARDVDQPMVEAEQPLQLPETLEELRETSAATITGLTSPRRPSLAPSDLPADDDVLASLLGGRTTPFLGVLPTPSDAGPSQRPRRAPKRPPRKRKPVLDVQMILSGELMRQQLADTSDTRRVRKRAPCTPNELWTAERLAKGSQVFNEPSVPGMSNALRELFTRMLVPGRANLPLAEPQREATPEVTREEVSAAPQAEPPVEEPGADEQRVSEPQPEESRPTVAEPAAELVEEPGLELPVLERPEEIVAEIQPEEGLELPAEVDIQLQPEQIPEAVITTEEVVEFPVLETEPGVVSEPQIPPSPPAVEPISIETEAQEETEPIEEARVQEALPEFLPMEEEAEVTELRGPAVGEEEAAFAEGPELLQEVAAEAEAVAEAVAEGAAVVVEGVNGRTIIVLEDDGTILDEGPSSFSIKEEIVAEGIQEEELGFLGEPRETVFLQDDDDDLNEETEPYDDSVQDVTVEGFSGWSARTRAVGGYLQGVFESLGATIERRQEDSPSIGLDHTLRGKTRKEAARLFFETLVLKTKDYVDVDQPQAYGEVYLSARPKLLKGSF